RLALMRAAARLPARQHLAVRLARAELAGTELIRTELIRTEVTGTDLAGAREVSARRPCIGRELTLRRHRSPSCPRRRHLRRQVRVPPSPGQARRGIGGVCHTWEA